MTASEIQHVILKREPLQMHSPDQGDLAKFERPRMSLLSRENTVCSWLPTRRDTPVNIG